MDALKKEFKEYRSCFTCLGVCIVLGIFGGITGVLMPKIGNYAFLAGLGGALLAILIWIGLARNARWAKVITGSLLSIIGLGLTAFIIYDFATSMIKGSSLLKTSAISASNYGQSAFIIFAFGVGLFGIGLALMGRLKLDN